MFLHSFIRVVLLFAFAAKQRAMATNPYLDAVIPSHVSLDLDMSHDDPTLALGESGHSAPSLFADYPSSGFEETVKGNKVRELRQSVATCLASKATGISHHPDQLGRGMCVVDPDAQGPRAEFIRYVFLAFNMYVASRKSRAVSLTNKILLVASDSCKTNTSRLLNFSKISGVTLWMSPWERKIPIASSRALF